MSLMHILEKIFLYQNLNPDDKTYTKMIRTILGNLDTIKDSTIYDIANMCFTSTTSVGRLCKQLGYDSFSSFHNAIKDVPDDYMFFNYLLPRVTTGNSRDIQSTFADTITALAENIRAIPTEAINQAVDLMYSKNCVHFFTHFPDPVPLLPLQMNLILTGKQSYYYYNDVLYDDGIKRLTPDSVACLIIPTLNFENPMLKVFRAIRETGTQMILLLATEKTCWAGADVQIVCEGLGSFLDSHLFAYLLELLSCTYRSKYFPD